MFVGKGIDVHEAFHKVDEGRVPFKFEHDEPTTEDIKAANEQKEAELKQTQIHYQNFGAVNSVGWKKVSWPRAMRIKQLYSKELNGNSAVFVGKQ